MADPNGQARRFSVDEDPTGVPVTVAPVTSNESPLAKAGPRTIPASPQALAGAVTKRPGEMAEDTDERTISGIRPAMSAAAAQRIIEAITTGFGDTVKKVTAGTEEK